MGKFKIIGITISVTWIMLIALYFFLESGRILWGAWMTNNALWIFVLSSIILVIGILTGAIAIGNMIARGKGLF